MTKRSAAAGAALLFCSGAAMAADLPSRRAPPVYVPPPPAAFTWTGFYIGGNAGYGFSTLDSERTTAGGGSALGVAVANGQLTSGTVPFTHQLGERGFVGGGQIGYNFQLNQGLLGSALGSLGSILSPVGSLVGGAYSGPVAGIEADAAYTDLRHNDRIAAAFGTSDQYHSRLGFLGTVRGRLGYGFDRLLIFATGGFAYGDTGYAHTYFSNAAVPAPIFSGGRSGIQTGYTVGGGVEYALPTGTFTSFGAGAVTLKAEYLYYDLGARTTTLNFASAAIPAQLFDRYRTAGNIVRAGLNFKFGEAPAPVVARY